MTIAELIAKLADYDPSTLVCYSDTPQPLVAAPYTADNITPIGDDVYPPEEIESRGEKFMCVVLSPSWWPR